MTEEERSLIQKLDKCDFGEIHGMHKAKVEARKNMSKEEKLVCNMQFIKVKKVITDRFRFIIVPFTGVERGQPENPRHVWVLSAGPPQRAHWQLQDRTSGPVSGSRRTSKTGHAEEEDPAGGRHHKLQQVRKWGMGIPLECFQFVSLEVEK